MQQLKFLTAPATPTTILLPSWKTSDPLSRATPTATSHSGTAPAKVNGRLTRKSILSSNDNPSQPVFSHVKCHRNSVTKRNATRLSINGRCTSKKGRHFLELTENEGHITEPNHSKGGTWLNHFSKSPSLCARATRMITNHAPTGEYQQRFFPKSCPCNNLALETRDIIICYTTNPGDSWTRLYHLTLHS